MPENSCRSKPGKGGFSFTRHPSERSDMYTKAGTTAFMDHILTLKKRKITGEFAHPLISRRVSAPSHPLNGRETAIPPAQRTECDAAQLRNAVCQPDTHSEAAGGGVRTRVPACCQNKKRGQFRPPALFDICFSLSFPAELLKEASHRNFSISRRPAPAGSPYPGVDEGDEVLHHFFRVGGIGTLDAEIELHLGLGAGGTHADPGVVFQLVKKYI